MTTVAPQHAVSAPAVRPPARFGRDVAEDLPGETMSVVVIRDLATLRGHVPAWERLVETAVEPNVFYEPWMLVPALEHLAPHEPFEVALVYAPLNKNPAAPPVLCGLFPLVRKKRRTIVPITTLELFRYEHCFLCTPLVRADRAEQAIVAFLDWVATRDGGTALKLRLIPGEGPFQELLVETLTRRATTHWRNERTARAMYRPSADFEDYLQTSLERKRRHEIRRLEKRIREEGEVKFARLTPECDLEAWLDDFLRVEARGWKGRNTTALANSAGNENFFKEVCRQAHRRGRLMVLALRLNGQPLAMKCNFLAADGGYAFKIAFDESLAKFSPGVLLEVNNIERLHERLDLMWMDSCAEPDHPMINRLWPQRRTIESMWISSGRQAGDLLVSALPLLKWVKRQLRRRPTFGRTPPSQGKKSDA